MCSFYVIVYFDVFGFVFLKKTLLDISLVFLSFLLPLFSLGFMQGTSAMFN